MKRITKLVVITIFVYIFNITIWGTLVALAVMLSKWEFNPYLIPLYIVGFAIMQGILMAINDTFKKVQEVF
jgi:hypothetical protein